MAHVINGSLTLRELIASTYTHYRSRFIYMKRDVLRTVEIIEVVELSRDRTKQPTKKFVIQTSSYPQYAPYDQKDRKGQYRTVTGKQRIWKHEYESVLEMDRLSLDTKAWSYRLGSEREIPKTFPWTQIKQLPELILKRWVEERDKKIDRIRASTKNKRELEKRVNQESKRLKEKIAAHKKKALYLDKGDYIARKYGINLDFAYKGQWGLFYSGHLYGRLLKTKPPLKKIPFATKHMLRLLDFLVRKNILS